MNILRGTPASAGIGIGAVFIIPGDEQAPIAKRTISANEVPLQWERFLRATEQVLRDIESMTNPANTEQAAIFDSYKMMLQDPVFIAQIKAAHESSLVTIEHVVFTQYRAFADTLRTAGDEYMTQRADDICDVFGRVVAALTDSAPFDMNTVPPNAVIVAQSLRPTDAVILERKKARALIVEKAGVTSHLGILVRNYGIPAVFGIDGIGEKVKNGETLIVDGTDGAIFVAPDTATLKKYDTDAKTEEARRKTLDRFRTQAAATKDGTRIRVLANIGTSAEAAAAFAEGADGIGLFRTEFLFMEKKRFLTEDEQFDVYKSVLQTAGDKPVTIRTLDLGADKMISALDAAAEADANPLLGYRAVRFCLDHRPVFTAQLRALFRASVYGNLKIMFPLICSLEELNQVLAVVTEVTAELAAQHIAFNTAVPLGIMVETAAAALTAESLAPKSAFFSIGTNDLTQYTLAVDRDNPKVSHLFSEFHPAVLGLIEQTVRAAENGSIPLSVCGEMASTGAGIALLVGSGVRTLSMSANRIGGAKELLSRFTVDEFSAMAQTARGMSTASEIRSYLQNALKC